MSLIKKFEENMNVVSQQVRKYRESKGLSYEELSAKLELMGISIHKQSIYDIECNRRTVKDYELYGFAKVFKIDVNDLLIDIKRKFEDG